jgi:hypothetical protein
VVACPYGHPNPPGRESCGQCGVPIAVESVPSRTAPRRRARWLICATGIIAILLLLLAGGAAHIVATNRAQHPAPSGPTTSRITALQQWWAGAKEDFTDMQDASAEVDQAFSHFKTGALAAACEHVHDAAEVRLQAHLPSPDPELTAELHAAIEDFHSAAHMCLAVAAGSPGNYDGEFLSSMAEANRHLRAAKDLINKALSYV